jgi:hypothetical protein
MGDLRQALPPGAATGGLQVGSLTTQTDVKNTWPDGSIRFAIVTVNATTAGSYSISPAAPSTGTIAPDLPTAAVVLTIDGVAYTAALPAAPAGDVWLSGPLVYEGRSIVAPASGANGSAHPFVRVIFDTRPGNDGAACGRVGRKRPRHRRRGDDHLRRRNRGQRRIGVHPDAVQHFYPTRWRKRLPPVRRRSPR